MQLELHVSIEMVRQYGIETWQVCVAGTCVAVYPSRAGAEVYCKRLEQTMLRQVSNCNDWEG